MDFMAWLYQFVLAANLLASQGYVYDLSSGQFIGPTGNRMIITAWYAPPRGRK